MTNLITRFSGLDEGFDDILRGFFVRPVSVDNTTAAPFKVARSFTLASELDATGAQAKYTDGVLELVLPKKAATSAKQVTIQ